MIEITHLCKSFGENEILKDISLTIHDDDIYGLVGVSGAGKSTILRCINGQIPYDSGSVKVDGKEVKDLQGKELRDLQKNTAMIFQHFNLMSRKTVYENIAFPMRCWKYDKKEIDTTVRELAEMVGIEGKLEEKPGSLSGGQKQRVAIARALAMKPKVLLSDEATSALDPKTAQSILDLLKMIHAERQISIVIVSHQMEIIRAICNRAVLLENGHISAEGTVKELFFRAPEAMEAFLGKKEVLSENEFTAKLMAPANAGADTILSTLCRDLGIDFRVIDAQTDAYRGDYTSIFTLGFPLERKADVARYLDDKKIPWIDESVDRKGK